MQVLLFLAGDFIINDDTMIKTMYIIPNSSFEFDYIMMLPLLRLRLLINVHCNRVAEMENLVYIHMIWTDQQCWPVKTSVCQKIIP